MKSGLLTRLKPRQVTLILIILPHHNSKLYMDHVRAILRLANLSPRLALSYG